MAEAARVDSIEVLKSLRTRLWKFSEIASAALGDADSEMQRMLNWLEREQASYWEMQARKRSEAVMRAADALRSKRLYKSAATGMSPSAAEEQQALDLRGCELVVLSACDTGLGQAEDGQGVLGLQRAFQLAGARSVVASLWKVPDEETGQLMRELYRRLWAREPLARAEALRQAQLWMLANWKPSAGAIRGGLELEKGKPGAVPPYVWAAFVLSGDWR